MHSVNKQRFGLIINSEWQFAFVIPRLRDPQAASTVGITHNKPRL